MAFKFFAFLAVASVASAGLLPAVPDYAGYNLPRQYYNAAPAYVNSVRPAYVKAIAAPVLKQVEYEAPAKYDFSYSVNDPYTGDVKEQSESRDGNNVHGFYSLIDADGYKRIVEYTADEHSGFNAVVRRVPLGGHLVGQIAKVVAPVNKLVAPVHYAAPTVAPYAAPAVRRYYAAAPVTSVQYAAAPGHYYRH